jgi:hypothetical protein
MAAAGAGYTTHGLVMAKNKQDWAVISGTSGQL